MKYQLLIDKKVEKQLKRIPSKDYNRLKEAILLLSENPRPSGFKKLSGRDGYRIRVGDYRVIYQIKDEKLLVIVISVGNRKDIYN